ncbi:hypothetical protein RSOLAG1IB_12340 [Rhizoctonia solani AG-1 IB]|uniref:Uncharacterized protein n=1 Tax=Thanatephorus cucumeris (strain AG1-IB / isolate 7/3/14) TaxID=1108050 RepID=A0A0B7FVW1_THACB|nr:hypothetical protein RSOLAG1IB_12340 [Rhizoctonia solani AG-1 IB]
MNQRNTRETTRTSRSSQATTLQSSNIAIAEQSTSQGTAANNAGVLLNQEPPHAPHAQPMSSLLVALKGHPGVFEADE